MSWAMSVLRNSCCISYPLSKTSFHYVWKIALKTCTWYGKSSCVRLWSNRAQRKDPTSTFLAAQALMGIQQTHGLFPRIIGKGDNANRLMELLLRMRVEAAADDNNTSKFGMMSSATIESLIIIDREIDFATPLLTQLTYEGLIEEMFGINYNQTEVHSSIVGTASGTQQSGKGPAATQQGLKQKIQLDSSDKLYEQLRDANGAIVDGLLNKVARRLQSDMKNRHAESISELRDFVGKLPGYQSEQQSLKIHINLTEEIMKNTQSDIFRRALEVQQNLYDGSDPSSQHDTLEELISRSVPLPTILRLLCLESCVSGGLRQKDLDNFKRLILHAYGYQHLLTLFALEKIGLLQTRSSAGVLTNPLTVGSTAQEGTKTNYNYLRKVLRLVVDDVNEQNPNDIAYVYSGYAPLTVRLVQSIIQKQYLLSLTKGASAANISTAAHGWQGFEDAVRNVKGTTFNKIQKGEEQVVKARHMLAGTGGKVKTVVVMFLGGVTFTEIAALRFVARGEEGRRRILICTTDVVGGNGIVGAAIEKGNFGGV